MIAIVDRLSSKMSGGDVVWIFSVLVRFCKKMASLQAEVRATSSLSVEESETRFCVRLPQEMGLPYKKKQ